MPKLKFKAGNRVAPLTPAVMTLDNTPCNKLYVRAHQDNTADIVIGDSENLTGATAAVKATAAIGFDTGDITVTAEQGGIPYNDVVISFETVADTPVDTPVAVATAGTIVITVNDTVNTTTANINTAVNGLTNWSAAVANAGVFNPGDVAVTATTAGGDSVAVVANRVDVLTNGTLTVTSSAAGAAWNNANVVLVEGGLGCDTLAVWNNATDTLTLQYDGMSGVSYSDMAAEVATNASDWVVSANAPPLPLGMQGT